MSMSTARNFINYICERCTSSSLPQVKVLAKHFQQRFFRHSAHLLLEERFETDFPDLDVRGGFVVRGCFCFFVVLCPCFDG